jgi:hypothetical protein
MRKKIYFQNNFGDLGDKEFALNGVKTTFGVFTKEFKERRPETSELLKKQQNYLLELRKKANIVDRYLQRPHGYTDFDYEKQFRWNFYKSVLFILALRELPLVNFYARSFIVAVGLGLVVIKSWKYFNKKDVPIYTGHWRISNDFANFPLLKQLVTSSVIPKSVNPA